MDNSNPSGGSGPTFDIPISKSGGENIDLSGFDVEEDKNETVETNAEDVTENVSEQETSSEESATQEDVVDAPVQELSEVDQLNEKIKELEATVTAEKDKYLRACAEIENVKKRKNQEIENTRKFSNEKLIQEFLL